MTARPLRLLLVATLGYLALPWALFLFGWLATPWAVGIALLLVYGLWRAGAGLAAHAGAVEMVSGWARQVRGWELLLLFVGALGITAISGVGGYGVQTGDWDKHNVVLRDLVAYGWPVYYDYYGRSVGLVYYIGWYLPAALVGKLLGLQAAHQALALWTLLGLLIAALWTSVLARRRAPVALLFLILYSGMSLVGFLLRFSLRFPLLSRATDTTEMFAERLGTSGWASGWQYTAHALQFYWVPQHALAGWIIAGLMIFIVLAGAPRALVPLVVALSALWSPLVTIGFAPFLVADLLPRNETRLIERLRGYISGPSAAALVAALVAFGLMLLFYATKLVPISSMADEGFGVATVFTNIDRWPSPWHLLGAWLLFCFLEFGVFFALDRFHAFRDEPHLRGTYWTIFVWLLLLPLVVFGNYNDLIMRASIPALFFVALITARNGFGLQGASRVRSWSWLFVLLLAWATPLTNSVLQIQGLVNRSTLHALDINPGRDVVEMYVVKPELLVQYVSSAETPFFRYLARKQPPADESAGRDAIVFGRRIALVNYDLSAGQVNPGDSLSLMLVLRAVEEVDRDYSVAVRLVDGSGRVLWEEQRWPVNAPTSTWVKERRLWHDQHLIAIPMDADPGLYRLEIYFADAGNWDKLPASDLKSGEPLGEVLPLAVVQVGSPPEAPQTADAPLFGAAIALQQIAVSPADSARAGENLAADLLWRAVEWPDVAYFGSLQLLDAGGRLVAQQDQMLSQSFLPPTLWPPGLLIPDRFDLQIPVELEPGVYGLVLVVYDPAAGRLPVTRAGQALGDTLDLGMLEIQAP